jgi:hypothetical protein
MAPVQLEQFAMGIQFQGSTHANTKIFILITHTNSNLADKEMGEI